MPLYAKEGDIISRVFPDSTEEIVGRVIDIHPPSLGTTNTGLVCFKASKGFNLIQVVVCADGHELDKPDIMIHYKGPKEQASRPITEKR